MSFPFRLLHDSKVCVVFPGFFFMLYTSSGLSSSTNYFFVQLRTRWGREKAGAKSDMCPKSALRVREEREKGNRMHRTM